MKNKLNIIIVIVLLVVVGFFVYRQTNQFDLPKGETISLAEHTTIEGNEEGNDQLISINQQEENMDTETTKNTSAEESTNTLSDREVFVTDGVKHSIPLGEILSGGPPKDGIPSIDNPKFVSVKDADEFLDDESVGLGVVVGNEKRFYPYQILVWHEIVNDVIGDTPALVTYCPLCATGIVFDPVVNGIAYKFGVSGKLWQSNLLMYNRTGDEKTESLWSQVLGESVLGPLTSNRLRIISSDTVRYGDWKKKNKDTKVLSRDTGAARTYGRDPYGDYYSDTTVGFGASFNDDRLHPKSFVLGIEVGGKYKAYHKDALKEGTMEDNFAGETIIITRDDIGAVRMFIGEKELSYIGGFWFSWLAVHPNTDLFK